MSSNTDRTIIFTRGGGRLGNQLVNYSNLLAFEQEYPEFDVINLSFRPYAALYGNRNLAPSLSETTLRGPLRALVAACWDNPLADRFGEYGQVDRGRVQLLHRFAHWSGRSQSLVGGNPNTRLRLPGQHYEQLDLADSHIIKQLREVPVSVVAGWGVRAWSLIDEHRDAIREQLRPGREYHTAATAYLNEIRKEYETVVGVLLRQGDYRNWQDGRYFFESERYRRWIAEYHEEYGDDDTAYLLASDEKQSTDLFGADRFRFATGEAIGPKHYLESFAELSQCDVILTPPSTFSTCAAFVGDVPVTPLYSGVDAGNWERLKRPLLDSVTHDEMSRSVK